jgi:hypothetical protein
MKETIVFAALIAIFGWISFRDANSRTVATTLSQTQSTSQTPAQPNPCQPLPWQLAADSIQAWLRLHTEVDSKNPEVKRQALENYAQSLQTTFAATTAYVQFASKIAPEEQIVPPDIHTQFQWTQCQEEADIKFIVLAKTIAANTAEVNLNKSLYGTQEQVNPEHLGYSLVVLDKTNQIVYVTNKNVAAANMRRAWFGYPYSTFGWSVGEANSTPLFKSIEAEQKDVEKKLKKLSSEKK